ncbi:MAG: hypothetical protein M1814_001034 [Vezdaea aestivalis]|nr:MAG: hypothetical protein M1814_001034 [Vezdaea aestivalis]
MSSYGFPPQGASHGRSGANGGRSDSTSFHKPFRPAPSLQNPEYQVSQIEPGPQSPPPTSHTGMTSLDGMRRPNNERMDLPNTPPTPPVPDRSSARDSYNPRFSFMPEEAPAPTQNHSSNPSDSAIFHSSTSLGRLASPTAFEPPPLPLFDPGAARPNANNTANTTTHATPLTGIPLGPNGYPIEKAQFTTGRTEPSLDSHPATHAPYAEPQQSYTLPRSPVAEHPTNSYGSPQPLASPSTAPYTATTTTTHTASTTPTKTPPLSLPLPKQTSQDLKLDSTTSEKANPLLTLHTGDQFDEKRPVASPQQPAKSYQPAYAPDSLGGPSGATLEDHKPGQIAHPNMRNSEDHWRHGLCDCGDVPTCCTGFWCPCVLYGQTEYRLSQKTAKKDPTDMLAHKAMNGSCLLFSVACGFQWAFAVFQHTRIHKTYEIPGSMTKDVLSSICCYSCMLMANEREVRDREEEARRNAGPIRKQTMPYQSPGGMHYA